MPDFRTAFINHVSTLRLTIKTRFACQEELDAPVKMSDDDDELWQGWFLPHPVYCQGSCRRSRLVHMANVSIIVVGPPPSAPIAPTHYLDAGALAPVLALPGATDLSFPSIGSLRLEEGPERKEHRYRRAWSGAGNPWSRSSGSHERAGAVWQRYEKSLAAAAKKAPKVDVIAGVSPRPAQGLFAVPVELAQTPAP
jgi:hypothetical protein